MHAAKINCSKHHTVSSPPLSPTMSTDEASNIKAILESVCHTDEIGKEAIAQLCKHVEADPQEESVSTHNIDDILICVANICMLIIAQELLTLLSHLDKKKVGYVSLDVFVRGLQFVRNAAVVNSTPLPNRTVSLRRVHNEVSVS